MLIRAAADVKSSEITPRDVFLNRRSFLVGSTATIALPAMLAAGPAWAAKLAGVSKGPFSTDEKANSLEEISSYNNFYELGLDKEDPKKNAAKLKTKPWEVVVEGECAKPGRLAYEDLVKPHQLQERIYRMRCVEAWSMVIPWVGIPLSEILARFEPTSKAKYVAFETIMDVKNLPGQGFRVLEWPYREGLRMDEAMHPLTMMAVGIYGEELLPQNGAPMRLVVPWKYGFKSIKSIVAIRFVENQPKTSWNMAAPNEYGFFSNVNPSVDHPRWSQAKERRIGEFRKRDTLPFNGYADQVAGLYSGMDLKTSF
jgi:sulfoxide reductase catalytic subunit YedY